MANQQVVEFIKNSLARNISLEEIKKVLLETGWKESEVNDAIASLNAPEPNKLPVAPSIEPAAKQIQPANAPVQFQQPQKSLPVAPQFPVAKSPAANSSLPVAPKQYPPLSSPSAIQQRPVAQPSPSMPSRPAEPKNQKTGSKSFIPLVIISGAAIFIILIAVIIFSIANSGKIPDEELLSGATIDLKESKEAKFNFNGEKHTLLLNSIQGNAANIMVQSTPVQVTLNVGEEKKFDLNSDEFYDLLVRLTSVENNKANFYIKQIHEKICTESWGCTEWGICSNSTQTRACIDANDCGTEEEKPEERQGCIMPPSCTELGGAICTAGQTCSGNTTSAADGNCCIGTCEDVELEEIDCGTDIDCLINASSICQPAILEYDLSSGNSTWNQITTSNYQIIGIENEKCQFYQEVTDATGNFSASTWTALQGASIPNEEINQMIQEISEDLIGKTETCSFPTTNLSNYLTSVKGDDYMLTEEDIENYGCTGDLY